MSTSHPTPDAVQAAARPSAFPLAILALLAAAAGALLVPWLAADPYGNPDAHAFEALARSLLAGQGLSYREPLLPALPLLAFRSPGYAGFLALGLGLGGLTTALALQGALTGATAALLAGLAARVAGTRAGWLALAAAAAWGLPRQLAGQLMSETLYAFLLASALWLTSGVIDVFGTRDASRAPAPRGSALRAVALGATLAAALLTRPSGFALLGSLALALPFVHGSSRRPVLAALAVALVLWSPWPLRNARVLGAPVASLTSGGLNAWAGNAGRPVGEGWSIMSAHADRGELGLDRMFWRMTRDEAAAHPMTVAKRFVGKVATYATPPPFGAAEGIQTLLWPLALAALWFAWRGGFARAAVAGLALVWFAHAAFTSITVVNQRYRFPTDGLVLVAGVLGIEALLRRHGVRRGAVWAGGLGVGGALLTTLARRML